jgi:tetratricopeptide (TPR) repeat protein
MIAVGLIAYYNCFHGPFIFDDLQSIVQNTSIRSLRATRWILRPPPEIGVSGRPALNVSLAVNYALNQLDVRGYHTVNLAIHIAAGLALMGILRRTLQGLRFSGLIRRHASSLALATALIWVAHPLQTMSVTYVIQRAESLMALFYLLTLYCVVRGADRSDSAGWYGLAVACSAIAMGTKEVAVSIPIVVLLYDRVFLAHSFAELFQRRRGLYIGLAASWLLLLMLVLPGPRSLSAGFGWKGITPWQYARTQPEVILHYLRLVFWPRSLSLDYGWPVANNPVSYVPAMLVVGTLLALSLWGLWRCTPWGFCGVAFFLILAPTSSIMPINVMASEHRMYLPSAIVIALCVVAGYPLFRRAWVARRYPLRWRTMAGALLVIAAVAGLAGLTIRRNRDYQSVFSIWADAAAKRPQNPRALAGAGFGLAQAGRFEEAIDWYLRALTLNRNDRDANLNLAQAIIQLGRPDEAIHGYAEFARRVPQDWQVQNSLGMMLLSQSRLSEAAEAFQNAAAANTNYAPALAGLAAVDFRQGRRDEAVERLRKAIGLRPWDGAIHVQLGVAYLLQERYSESIESFLTALALDPEDAAARTYLARALASAGRSNEALEAYRGILAAHPSDGVARVAYARLLAQSGDVRAAIGELRRALAGHPENREARDELNRLLDTNPEAHEPPGR